MLALAASLVPASPAFAQDSSSVPDPTDLTLFALGVAGVIIGRHAARKRPPD